MRGPESVLGRSLLIAAAVTIAVGILLVVVLTVSDVLFVQISGRDADTRLASIYTQFSREPDRLASAEQAVSKVAATAGYGQTLIWQMGSDGRLVSSTSAAPALPAAYRHLSGFASVQLQGQSLRLYGGPLPSGWLVVGTGLQAIQGTRQGVLQSQLSVLPAALVAVFLAGLAVGRWVAAPIERARKQQLAFTANASHELRTPLAVLQGEVSLALSRKRAAAGYRQALERVAEEGEHMGRLVDDLVWLARFESEPREPESELVPLGEAARHAAGRFSALAAQRHLGLTVMVCGQPLVVAPTSWIDRLLGVLLANACTYTPEGGRVEIRVADGGDGARLLVDDSGPGIPPAERLRIFARFHRATSEGGGAGLGLAIADAIVRSSHGVWDVGSSPLGGARFAVRWRVVSTVPRQGTSGSPRSTTIARVPTRSVGTAPPPHS